MTFKEFYKSLIFKNREIYVPSLRMSIDKTQFVGSKGYNVEDHDKFLVKIYEKLVLDN